MRTLVRRTWCILHSCQAGHWKVNPRFRNSSLSILACHLFSMGGSLGHAHCEFMGTGPQWDAHWKVEGTGWDQMHDEVQGWTMVRTR